MIYKASHHPLIYPFFRLYTRWKISRNFHGVIIKGDHHEKNLPVLLITNHISWWDGFWAEYLNMKIFHRKFYFMMQEDQLKKHMFFNRTGGYSVKKGSRSIIETLNYTSWLLADSKNLVLVFPQGKIESIHNQNLKFKKGIEYILRKVKSPVQIIFLVNLIEYFAEAKPGLIMHFKEYSGSDYSVEVLQKYFNIFYSCCVAENIRISASL